MLRSTVNLPPSRWKRRIGATPQKLATRRLGINFSGKFPGWRRERGRIIAPVRMLIRQNLMPSLRGSLGASKGLLAIDGADDCKICASSLLSG
jgi:hypothetical protein